jgi:hypothetical protein
MKVALLGAPGSGKSKVARLSLRRLNRLPLEKLPGDQTNPPGRQWKIIDGYVEKLQERTGLPFGEISTFPHNLAVITDRWVREAEAQGQGLNTITCGSIYESILYSTFSTLITSSREDGMVHDQMFHQVMMHTLGALESSTYDYDAIFWLPWTQEHYDQDVHSWAAVVNAKRPEALDGFSKSVIPLIGSDKVRADRVVEVIRAIAEITSPPDDEPSVRLRTEPSSDA